jgi:CrcB protein
MRRNNGVSKLILIMAGGSVGALLRYLLAGFAQRLANGSFPLGTLVVNVVGCLLMGLAGAMFAGPHLIREEYRMALLVGFIGAFTTFSTFGAETFSLANAGQFRLAAVNILLSNGLCLVAVWFGYRMSEKWFGV